jgi:hypothetical protein
MSVHSKTAASKLDKNALPSKFTCDEVILFLHFYEKKKKKLLTYQVLIKSCPIWPMNSFALR